MLALMGLFKVKRIAAKGGTTIGTSEAGSLSQILFIFGEKRASCFLFIKDVVF